MTPADELRAAAQTLRTARFAGAMTNTPTGARLIAARLPLADWLAKLADFCDSMESVHGQQPPADNLSIVDALAVARAINGGAS